MTTINAIAHRGYIKPSFKGISETENGVPYHKANTGTVAGGIVGGLSLLQWLGISSQNSILKDVYGNANINEKAKAYLNEQNARTKKYLIPFMAIAAGCSIGCGILVDYLRNKKAAEAADNLANDPEKAMYQTEGLEYSEMGLPYYKSKIGTKIGAGLGALCGLAHTAMLTTKNSPNKVMSFISNAVIFAVGGFVMGAITDKVTNNKAKTAAVKMQMGNWVA